MMLQYERRLSPGLTVRTTRTEDAEQLEALQETVFPTLAPEELFRAPHYRRHVELFPEGQFVVVTDEGEVVGMTTAMRMEVDFDHPDHTFEEVMAGGWLTTHDPGGDWLYGLDVGTHPDYRRRGIARALYAARHETVRRLGLKGQVTVGMLNGYEQHAEEMSVREYYERVAAGELTDPTVSTQQRVGFEIRRLVENYLHDPKCGNAGALIVLPAEKDI